MYWRFTLTRLRDNHIQGLTTLPMGWDTGTANITRDPEKHGVAFDYAIGSIRYYKEGADLISAEYDLYGTEAKMTLTIEYACYEGATWQLFYTGALDFGSYKKYSGPDCYVMVNLESTDVVMTLKNRYDQKVNLESTASFNGTAMAPYANLGKIIILPSKAIPVSDSSNVSPGTTSGADFVGGLQEPYSSTEPVGIPTNLNINHINIGQNNTIANEIGNFFVSDPILDQIFNGGTGANFGSTFIHHVPGELNPLGTEIWPLGTSPLLNYAQDSPSYKQLSGPVHLEMSFSGTIQNPRTYINARTSFLIGILPQSTRSDFGEQDSDYRWLYGKNLNDSADANDFIAPGGTIFIADTVSLDFTLNPGDRLYCFISFNNRSTQAQIDEMEADSANYGMRIEYDDTSFIKLTNLSRGGDIVSSPAKTFLINETLSRITESITDTRMRAVSDYFGRTDSSPYQSAGDGCGALECLTNGLFIRGVDQVKTDTPPFLSLSLEDVFNGLNAIHNIGYGIDDDPFRAGFKVLRVEPWKYFYKNTVIFTANNIVTPVVTESVPGQVFSQFAFGYAKWEAQQYTGLDEFLTKRTYRTSLTSVRNTLNQVCDFIASGYTIEITRRVGHDTSQDFSYDNDTFIICLKRGAAPLIVQISRGHNSVVNKDRITFNSDFGSLVPGDTIEVIFNNTLESYTVYNTMTVPAGTSSYTVNQSMGTSQIPLSPGSVNGQVYINGVLQLDPAGMGVEQGNIQSPENIIDPPTIYNYRISPARNALRWLNRVIQSYKSGTGDLIFTDGDGNVYAKGELLDGDPCKLEAGPIQENQILNPAAMENPADGAPVLSTEMVTFDYPLSVEDFVLIKSNRLDKIGYEVNGATRYGWISALEYRFEENTATFKLIPEA